jgi:hypothetical protein
LRTGTRQDCKGEVVLRQILAEMDKGILGGKRYAITLSVKGLVIEFNEKYKLPEDCRDEGRAPEVSASTRAGTRRSAER